MRDDGSSCKSRLCRWRASREGPGAASTAQAHATGLEQAARVYPATIREFFAANTVLTLDTLDELRELEVGSTQAVFVLEKGSFFRRDDDNPRRPDDRSETIVSMDGHRFVKPKINKGPEGDKGKPGQPGREGDKGLPGDNVRADSNLRKVSIPFNIFAQDAGVIPAGDYGWIYLGFECEIVSFDVVADAPEPPHLRWIWMLVTLKCLRERSQFVGQFR